jgi:hypothetical protein
MDWDVVDKALANDQEAIATLSIELADTKSDLLALVRYHKAFEQYWLWQNDREAEAIELKAAQAAPSDRVKRMLSEDSDGDKA